jgi:hypothetical protein
MPLCWDHMRYAIIIVLAVFQIHSACAASAELDEKLRKEAAETPDAALVFMEVELIPKNGRVCGGGIFATVKAAEGKLTQIITRSNTGFFGNSISFHGGAAVLPSGMYTIVSFGCSGERTFKGPVARFFLHRGEVINAGRLVLDYDLAFFTRSKADLAARDMSPEAVASLSERAPNAFSKAKKRYLTLTVGMPAQTERAPQANGTKQ